MIGIMSFFSFWNFMIYLGQARNERQHVFYWLACKVKESFGCASFFFYLDRKVKERKALCGCVCVCVCVCVFHSFAK